MLNTYTEKTFTPFPVTTCNSALNMDQQSIQQAELELVIRDFVSSGTRVSCDFTIQAGLGKQVMFYFTDVYLGSPNKTDWIDRSCVEIRDVNGYYESVPKGWYIFVYYLLQIQSFEFHI